MSINALLPVLEALPGYPVAPTPSLLDLLVIIVAIPAAIGIPIFLIAMGKYWMKGQKA